MTNFILEKIYKNNLSLTEEQIANIEKLYQDHKNKKISVFNHMNTILKQVEYGVDDIYKRFYLAKSKLNPKDSSSLKSLVIRYGEVLGSQLFENKSRMCSGTLENFIRKHGEEEGKKRYKQKQEKTGLSLDKFVAKYGEEEGKKRYEKFWKENNFSISERSFIRRFGEEEGKKRYQEICEKIGYRNTLEGHIEKYGEEEGTRLYKERNSRKSKSQSKETMVKRLLKQNKTEEEIIEAIKNRWANSSLESFIKRYGKEDGTQKYNHFIEKMKSRNKVCKEFYDDDMTDQEIHDLITEETLKKTLKSVNYSKESLKCLEKIINEIEEITGYVCKYKEKEFFIRLDLNEYNLCKKRFFFYDFYFKNLKMIIEYHGERYHDKIDYEQTLTLTEKDFYDTDILNMDLYKKWLAEQRGYEVIVIRAWEKQSDLLNLYAILQKRGIDICKSLFF